MHELSVCQALITQIEGVAREQSAQQVLSIELGIGPLSGVEANLLIQAYPIAAAGTVAENAVLKVRDCPVRVHCTQCGEDSDAAINRLVCAGCGDWRTELISGDELLLMHLELIRENGHV